MMRDSAPRYLATPQTPRRTAITLVEVIGTLSVLLVLGVSAANLLAAITDIGVGDVRAKQGRASIERLAEIFRDDVHDADNVFLVDQHWPVEMTTGATTVRYAWDQRTSSIRRSSSAGQKRLAVDRFQLPHRCDPRVSLSNEIVTVVLLGGKQTQPWVIEASRR